MSDNDSHHAKSKHGGFSESWLALREPADHRARNSTINNQLVEWFRQQDSHNVLELGAGTGSNLRYLMPQLGHDQYWLLLDNDAGLFQRLPDLLQCWASSHHARFDNSKSKCRIEHDSFSATIEYRVIDLASDVEQIPSDNFQLLTASALLDLTSADWLKKISTLVYESQCACLFALNYNGKIQWRAELEADCVVSSLLNQHQLNDKGFGLALGPEAGHFFSTALKNLGRQVKTGNSDWVIKPHDRELQLAIVEGWSPAALEQDDSQRELISQWHLQRKQAIEQGMSTLTVGHIDVLSIP